MPEARTATRPATPPSLPGRAHFKIFTLRGFERKEGFVLWQRRRGLKQIRALPLCLGPAAQDISEIKCALSAQLVRSFDPPVTSKPLRVLPSKYALRFNFEPINLGNAVAASAEYYIFQNKNKNLFNLIVTNILTNNGKYSPYFY